MLHQIPNVAYEDIKALCLLSNDSNVLFLLFFLFINCLFHCQKDTMRTFCLFEGDHVNKSMQNVVVIT